MSYIIGRIMWFFLKPLLKDTAEKVYGIIDSISENDFRW